jgi:hypothetical protein
MQFADVDTLRQAGYVYRAMGIVRGLEPHPG